MGKKLIHIYFRKIYATVYAPAFQHVGMYRAKFAYLLLAYTHYSLPAGLIEFAAACSKLNLAEQIELFKQLFHSALEREVAFIFTAEQQSEHLPFFRQAVVIVKMHVAHFKEPVVSGLAALIALKRIEHAHYERCAHQALVLAKWVQYLHALALFAVLIQKQSVKRRGAGEVIIIHFIAALRRHFVLHLVLKHIVRAKLARERIAIH